MKLTKKIVSLIEEKTSCNFLHFDKDRFIIYVDNSYCEDYEIEMNRSKNEVEELITYCDDFDTDEHFKLWYGANRGEPQSPSMLLKNCEEIGDNLSQLADLLRGLLK